MKFIIFLQQSSNSCDAEKLCMTRVLAEDQATKLWNGESLKAVKTSLVDEDVTTLLYREAENALMDAAVLYLPSREVVASPKFQSFFESMGDRLVVMANTENAAANWRVENKGADFYDNPDVGLEVCKVFAQQSYYYQLVPINNWQVTFFRAYPFPWELWIEDLNYNLVKLGESEQKPSYDQILAWTEAYEESTPKSPCYFCCFVALLLHAASHIAEMLMFGESIQKAQERQKQRERERKGFCLSASFSCWSSGFSLISVDVETQAFHNLHIRFNLVFLCSYKARRASSTSDNDNA